MCNLLLSFVFVAILFGTATQCQETNERAKRSSGPSARVTSSNRTSFSCDFDVGYCGWENDTTSDFSWLRIKGETPSKHTGPPWDHTTREKNGGYYIYIETSHPRKRGDKARIMSPAITRPGNYCLSFWHHMHGSDIRDLNVYTREMTSRLQDMIVHLSGPWSVETANQKLIFGQDGDWWNRQQTQFAVVKPTRIIFEAIYGENYRGDIAVDDIAISAAPCVRASIDCNFENNTCGWMQMSDDDFNWMPNQGQTGTVSTGPDRDHTIGNKDGRYMYAEASWPREEGHKARFLSPPVTCVENARPTFQFWYHMHGVSVGPLRVFIVEQGNVHNLVDPAWMLRGEQGGRWKEADVQIPTEVLDRPFQIIIESERKEYRGDVAIDDVRLLGCYAIGSGDQDPLVETRVTPEEATVHSGPEVISKVTPNIELSEKGAKLPDGISCNFDEGFCKWKPNKHSDFDWTLNRGKTASLKTGPEHDHTSGDGYYMFTEASSPRSAGQMATISSPVVSSQLRVCVRFHFHMYGETMGKLEVLTTKPGSDRLFHKWSADGQKSTNEYDWRFAQVDISESFNFQIVFRAILGTNFYSDIAVDDVNVSPTSCRSSPKQVQSVSRPPPTSRQIAPTSFMQGDSLRCDFETSHLCGWTQPVYDQFDWTISNKTPSPNTGPLKDHKDKEGKFAFIEASSQSPRDRARLQSSFFTLPNPACFTMWYHMYGNSTGSLSIYSVTQGNSTSEVKDSRQLTNELLWQRSGNHGDKWNKLFLNLKESAGMRLAIEGERGLGWKGDIAIDDIEVLPNECPIFNCTFDTNLCGWRQNKKQDDFDWTRTNNVTPSANTGPRFDHTRRGLLGHGHYLFVESSKPREKGDRAKLTSPLVKPGNNPNKCLSFWYHSHGSNIGQLNVYKRERGNTNPFLDTVEWFHERDEGDRWLFAKVDIDDVNPYQIIFEGVRGEGFSGDIAIDDVTIADGMCDKCCGDDVFQCGNGYCVPASQRCNNVQDCGDGSDESECGGCGKPVILPRTSSSFGGATELGSLQISVSPVSARRSNNQSRTNYSAIASPRRVAQLPSQQVKRIRLPNLRWSKLPQLSTGIRTEIRMIPNRGLGHPAEIVPSRRRRGLPWEERREGHWGGEEEQRKSHEVGEDEENEQEERQERKEEHSDREEEQRKSEEDVEDEEDEKEEREDRDDNEDDKENPREDEDVEEEEEEEEDEQPSNRRHSRPRGFTSILWRFIRPVRKSVRKVPIVITTRKPIVNIRMFGRRPRPTPPRMSRRPEPIPTWQWRLIRSSLNRDRTASRGNLLYRIKRSALKKISGGNKAKAHSWPWQVAYYVSDTNTKTIYFCGGTLIHRYWILTAAHCPTLGDDHSVVVGAHDIYDVDGNAQEVKVDVVYINKVYQFSEDLVGDIALVKLRYPVVTTNAVQPACLLNMDDERFGPGHVCATTGWGRTEAHAAGVEQILRQGEVPIISHEICQTKFWSDYVIHDSMVCAGATGANTCLGDSGGPLMCKRKDKYYLVGITSWGDTKCKATIPGIYTRVQSYFQWINKIINSKKCTP